MSLLKVLIVDDEEDTCFLLSGILRQNQYDVSFVHSISDARAALEKDVPDVVFLDNHLKDGRGIDFISPLIAQYPNIKVIMISAFDTALDKQAAFAKGAHYFIGKPFSRSTVGKALESVLSP